MAILAEALIEKFQQALDEHWGYIYGKSHEVWSLAKQKAYVAQYSNDPDRATSCKYGAKWDGKIVTDCSGLFAWSFKQLGGSIAHGSNSIWNGYLVSKGELKNGKRTDNNTLKPGTAVFTSTGTRHNHIGLYIGNGIVIEAMGTQAGVTTTKITNSKWTHWGELKNVYYKKSDLPEQVGSTMEIKEVNYKATVIGGKLNFRSAASTSSNKICQIPENIVVDVTGEISTGWSRINYQGKSGYVVSKYLKKSSNVNLDIISVSKQALTDIYKKLLSINDKYNDSSHTEIKAVVDDLRTLLGLKG